MRARRGYGDSSRECVFDPLLGAVNVASEHWKDLHRTKGRFKKRPGAKGFKPLEEKPPEDKPEGEKGNSPLSLWVEKNRGRST